jgi:hypothetical protein
MACARLGGNRERFSDSPSPEIVARVEGEGQVESLPIDWSRPQPGYAVEAASVEEAAMDLAFAPIVPRFGTPSLVFMSPEEETVQERALWLVFEEPEGVPCWVIELAAHPDYPPNYDEAIEHCAAEPDDCAGIWTTVIVRDGIQALLTENEATTEFDVAERAGLR